MKDIANRIKDLFGIKIRKLLIKHDNIIFLPDLFRILPAICQIFLWKYYLRMFLLDPVFMTIELVVYLNYILKS